jgi:excisionase family DNA binding protein
MRRRMRMSTIEELRQSEKVILSSKEVGHLLRMHPQTINQMAKDRTLPFPFIRSGNRTKIPRLALIKWLEEGRNNDISGC